MSDAWLCLIVFIPIFLALAFYAKKEGDFDLRNQGRYQELKTELDYLRNSVSDQSTFSKVQAEINTKNNTAIKVLTEEQGNQEAYMIKMQDSLLALRERAYPKKIEFELSPLKGPIQFEIVKPPPLPKTKRKRK